MELLDLLLLIPCLCTKVSFVRKQFRIEQGKATERLNRLNVEQQNKINVEFNDISLKVIFFLFLRTNTPTSNKTQKEKKHRKPFLL